jgi:hypothetical protein
LLRISLTVEISNMNDIMAAVAAPATAIPLFRNFLVSIPRQSRGLYDVSRSKRLDQTANAV